LHPAQIKVFKMKKVIIYIVTACIICCNYAFRSKCSFLYERNYDNDTILAARELCAKLEAAYQSSSKNDLERFLRDWKESLPPNSVEFIKQNDIIEAIFDIYELIYKPIDTLKAGNFSETTAYPLIMRQKSNYNYVIVQNKIYYEIIENEDNFGKLIAEPEFSEIFGNRDSINDFRPPLKLEKFQALYSLPKYEEAFKMFLGVPMIRGRKNTNPLTAGKDDERERYDFLLSHIPFEANFFGWNFVNSPRIYCIYFDKSITTAIVDFFVLNWGGRATMKKEANEWTIDEIHVVWIF
jgi:hypothetical protein